MDDESFKDYAVHSFKVRLYCGFIFGSVVHLVGIIFLVLSIIYHKWDFIGYTTLASLLGLILGFSCGYYVFKKDRRKL